MNKTMDKDLQLKYLTLIANCYATGDFEPLFPYLSEDCVWESQWRLDPEDGKAAVEAYFREKGEILKEYRAFPKWTVVEFVDNMNLIRPAKATVDGETKQNVVVGLLYDPGELALYMTQDLEDGKAESMLRIKVNEENLIKRIDMCMPGLFKFVKYVY